MSKNKNNLETVLLELKPFEPRFLKLSLWLYSKSYGFHISALFYIILAILIISLGVYLSIYLDDSMWLSRFGSLIVVLGILFGVHGVEGKIDSDINYCNTILNAMDLDELERLQQVKHESPKSGESDYEKKIRQKKSLNNIFNIIKTSVSISNTEKRKSNWQKNIKNNTFRIDATIAIIGTILWAFGDLLI